MNYQRRQRIGRLANRIHGVLELGTPVDPSVAVGRLGGRLESLPGNAEYEALIRKEGDDSFVIKMKGTSPARRRFMIAHMLGHLFLHMGFLVEEVRWQSAGDYEDSALRRYGHSEEESEAREFANAFLMPECEFRMIAGKNQEGGRYNLGSLRAAFQVPMDAIRTRGRWLGLFPWD